ncbi:MAG: homoserine dehydrogenase [Acidimicrobiales bacterium]|nr:homoserine dehydrogenase [Acidimicrobiales bacterium]
MTSLPLRIGLVGCGTVGAALVELLTTQVPVIEARTGLRLEIERIAVRDPDKDRGLALMPGILTTDAHSVVTDPAVDVVVEVMGGVEPARSLILTAIECGKAVVTANKELLATAGAEVFAAAEEAGVDVLFEAAVAGGIPLVRPLRESLLGEPIRRVMGIVNGTTNYILTRMSEQGVDYEQALAEAQRLGYAEADPTADVEGYDAAAKCAILASIAFGVNVVVGDVYHEGITGIAATDIRYADRKGYVIKLLAVAERFVPELDRDPEPAEISVRVHPVLVPANHPLASVRESFNAVFVEGAAVGELMFYGRGAGGGPTASALLGDLIDAAVNRSKGSHATVGTLRSGRIRPIEDLDSEYYICLDVVDRPGVLAAVAGVFGRHGVSILSMEQEGLGDEAQLMFITHTARERSVRDTLADLRKLEVVHRIGSVIRVLGES